MTTLAQARTMIKRLFHPPADPSTPFVVLYASAFRDEIVVCHVDDLRFRDWLFRRVTGAAFRTYEAAWRFAKDLAAANGLRFEGVVPIELEPEDDGDEPLGRQPQPYCSPWPRRWVIVRSPDTGRPLTVVTRDSLPGRRPPWGMDEAFEREDDAWCEIRRYQRGPV